VRPSAQLARVPQIAQHQLRMMDVRAVPLSRVSMHLGLGDFLIFEQLQQSGVTDAKNNSNFLS
jgi:hypothetical protein